MMTRTLAWTTGIWLALASTGYSQRIEFNRDIRPILSDNCFTCHGPAKASRKADLRFDTEEGAKADLGGHRAIVAGKPNESTLIERVVSSDPADTMPPPSTGKKLTKQQIALLTRWIEQGAPWQDHWSFIAPKAPSMPTVKRKDWSKNPIDEFILANLEANGLAPAKPASREKLIRRVTLDLTGLPPSIAEIDAFLADSSPKAYDRVVERLLASPRFGERMVLEWLDAARYSDTNGYQTDGTRAMWPWRDWVIDALNRNVPFDQFTIEQFAGDLLPNPTVAQKIATGFHRNHMINGEGGRIAEESRVDYVVDRVNTTGAVWLGLTIGCSQCHEHKYDPISQKEFYQVYAFFNNITETGGVDRRNSTAAPTLELPTESEKTRIADLEKKVAEKESQLREITKKLEVNQDEWEKTSEKLPDNVKAALKAPRDKRNDADKKTVREFFLGKDKEWSKANQETEKVRKDLTNVRNNVLITMIMEERKEPRDSFVLERGIYNKYGEKVQTGLPKSLPPLPSGAPNNRLGLARWLVDRNNPLTARVTVNRFWQSIFGTGLVKTSEDFGAQGELPSHPELLDWLAVQFKKQWDMKEMFRLIVTSAAYQQDSEVSQATLERDPDNRLLSRGPRLRLSPFVLRDQALLVSGLLVEKLGGPPVRPYQPPGLWEDFSFNQIRYTQDKGESLYRRSLYTFWRRSIGPPNMFDTSSRQVCTVRQSRTNTPLHSLILFNDVTFVEAARVWAERLLDSGGKTPDQRLHLAFRQLTSRQPTATEQQILRTGFERALQQYRNKPADAEKLVSTGEWPRSKRYEAAELAAYTAIANMLLNLDEVVTRE